MGFFKKNKESVGAEDKAAINSILDEGMFVAGDVSFKGKARVDGRIEGNVSGDYLILSESGIIIGDLEAEVVVCQGRVDGNIKAKKLHAQHAAKINGSLDVLDLTVDSGASLNGDIKAHSQDLRLVEGAAQSTNFNNEITSATHQDQGLRIKSRLKPDDSRLFPSKNNSLVLYSPCPFIRAQKIFGSMPCPIGMCEWTGSQKWIGTRTEGQIFNLDNNAITENSWSQVLKNHISSLALSRFAKVNIPP